MFKRFGDNGRYYVLIVLKALMEGHRIEIDGYTWAMSEDGNIGIEWKSNEVSGCTYLTVGAFIQMCEKVTQEQIVILGAAMALSKMKRSR